MQVSVIDIGTSKGIRIPASILKDFDMPNSFELKIQNHKIILDVINNPRNGWDAKFKDSENELIIDDVMDAKDWDDL